ncbi:PREDICTED: probable carboxylesterase 3 [Camelina sativa]|uniref:Probable carboxylesterase 3 n=1 Tax=Camelina sativa TaxID=90675 RepID=A0ABM0YGF0_CAMSA|nr:PREDICTED: probable carboxylesterase 3 [Camelina sativa]
MESDHTTDHHHHHLPSIQIHKNGRVDRLVGSDIIPTSLNPKNDVVSKDVVYSPEHNLSVRMFLPHKSTTQGNKLPLLIYFHGGAYITQSPFSPVYHNYLTEVVKTSNCLAVSVQYRLAPEHPVPAAYDDSWSAIQWIYSHSDDWINEHTDFNRVFIAGDSAGANIAHQMGIRAGKEKLKPRIKGIVMVHPGFWGKEPIDELDVQEGEVRSKIAYIWEKIVSPNSVDGVDDPWFNVVGSGSDISGLGCEKVLVAVAGKDVFWRQGLAYATKLRKSEWQGVIEVVEDVEEGHCFHLHNPNSQNASKMMKRFVEFIIQ